MARLRRASRLRRVALSTALAAGGALVGLPQVDAAARPTEPVSAVAAWNHAQRAVIGAQLPDGSAYQPKIFLDAHTSVGTAESPDGSSLRLLLVGDKAPARQLRRLPLAANPSFQAFAVSGDVLAWVEGAKTSGLALWSVNVRGGRSAHKLTADLGDPRFYHSQYDLLIADGRVHWAASGPDRGTEIRSVVLGGGPVETRTEAGAWTLSAWPWLVNGTTETAGTTLLRNLATGADVAVPRTTQRASTTNCSPAWCRTVSLSEDGFPLIELTHPDGTARERVAGDTAATVIADVAPLDRFEVFSQIGPNSALTGNVQLLVFEVATRRTVEITPDADRVSYLNGVLCWSTGSMESYVWHAIDLRTV